MWDEQEAFSAASRGDETAFEQIVFQYEKKVYQTALHYLGNVEDAKDAAQEVFVKLWRTLPRFRGDCSPTTWILRITRTVTVDLLRKNRLRQTDPLFYENEEGETVSVDLPDEDPNASPPDAVVREETNAAVRSAIADLPEHFREILTLRDLNGISYADIGQYLGIDAGTVKSRLARARTALKNLLIERNIL